MARHMHFWRFWHLSFFIVQFILVIWHNLKVWALASDCMICIYHSKRVPFFWLFVLYYFSLCVHPSMLLVFPHHVFWWIRDLEIMTSYILFLCRILSSMYHKYFLSLNNLLRLSIVALGNLLYTYSLLSCAINRILRWVCSKAFIRMCTQ